MGWGTSVKSGCVGGLGGRGTTIAEGFAAASADPPRCSAWSVFSPWRRRTGQRYIAPCPLLLAGSLTLSSRPPHLPAGLCTHVLSPCGLLLRALPFCPPRFASPGLCVLVSLSPLLFSRPATRA